MIENQLAEPDAALKSAAPPLGERRDQRGSGRGKRIVETALVLSPAPLLAVAFFTGTFEASGGSVLVFAGLVLLAALVWTQKWPSYLLVAALGVVLCFDRSLIALASWSYAAVLLLIAIANLVVFPAMRARDERAGRR